MKRHHDPIYHLNNGTGTPPTGALVLDECPGPLPLALIEKQAKKK